MVGPLAKELFCRFPYGGAEGRGGPPLPHPLGLIGTTTYVLVWFEGLEEGGVGGMDGQRVHTQLRSSSYQVFFLYTIYLKVRKAIIVGRNLSYTKSKKT